MDQFEAYQNIPKEKFQLADPSRRINDIKLDTKPVGYLKDAFNRFAKNKASLIAAIIIGVLVLFAIIGPFFGNDAFISSYQTDITLKNYQFLRPRAQLFVDLGWTFWDGGKDMEVSENAYQVYRAMEKEMGKKIITREYDSVTTTDAFGKTSTLHKIRIDTYTGMKVMTLTLTADKYAALQEYQTESGHQVILPRSASDGYTQNPNIWFQSDKKGNAKLDKNGDFIPAYATSGSDDYNSTRLADDPGTWKYAQRTGTKEKGYNYVVRLDTYEYFIYRYGFEPSFFFGTDTSGYDIFSRLASGARFSFLLAIAVSVINLTIGAIYGAIEGYYGGAVDMVMERISDIISGIPFTVVAVLFNLHLADKVGIVPALLFAFVMTGWIGMASRVRMQFYRFKNQEYVMAARTLGANDFRVMFKHIFPNSLGTIITGSVLVIPGVIFSETSLSYLGIINLDSASMSSVGSMLSAGQGCMSQNPHVVLFPALFIALLEISFNLFGNGLRDAFNPSLRGSEG